MPGSTHTGIHAEVTEPCSTGFSARMRPNEDARSPLWHAPERKREQASEVIHTKPPRIT